MELMLYKCDKNMIVLVHALSSEAIAKGALTLALF
jgi:hypothetical protein